MTGFEECKSRVLQGLQRTPLGVQPFHHLYVDEIFPPEFYAALKGLASEFERGGRFQARKQDNRAYVNRRCNLVNEAAPEARLVYDVFSDPEVKRAALSRFYSGNLQQLADSLCIHEEFEFTFTAAGRFQNIHVDIPPKYLSFVFYLPDGVLDEDTQRHNATILYDRNLRPYHYASYRANSVCIFAPHLYTYHGFSTTVDRPALVLFYVNPVELREFNDRVRDGADVAPYDFLMDAGARKLLAHPLIEYGDDPGRVARERAHCRVNAPMGRVIPGGKARPWPGLRGVAGLLRWVKSCWRPAGPRSG